MDYKDNIITQLPPHLMPLEERLDEVAMYMMRGVTRLKKKKDEEGYKGSFRAYINRKQKRKTREKKDIKRGL